MMFVPRTKKWLYFASASEWENKPRLKRTRDDVVVAAGSKNVSIILTNSTVTSLTIQQHYENDDEDEDEYDDEDEDDNS